MSNAWFADPQELRRNRMECGFTQKELAQAAGVRQSVLAEIETGKRTFTDHYQKPLWRALTKLDEQRRDHKRRWDALLGKLPADEAIAEFRKMEDSVARSFGSIENFRQTMRDVRELATKQRQIEELWQEVKKLRTQVVELRDLLGLKTEAALAHAKAADLEDRIEGAE